MFYSKQLLLLFLITLNSPSLDTTIQTKRHNVVLCAFRFSGFMVLASIAFLRLFTLILSLSSVFLFRLSFWLFFEIICILLLCYFNLINSLKKTFTLLLSDQLQGLANPVCLCVKILITLSVTFFIVITPICSAAIYSFGQIGRSGAIPKREAFLIFFIITLSLFDLCFLPPKYVKEHFLRLR